MMSRRSTAAKRHSQRFFIAIALVLSCLLAGCGIKTQDPAAQTAGTSVTERKAKEENETGASPSFQPETAEELDFRCVYKGFTAVSAGNREMLERFRKFGEQTIENEEAWSAFTAFYCPGIPYDEPWDFSEEYLFVSISQPADPAYTGSDTIVGLVREDGRLVPEYENNPESPVYALNTEEFIHFYVEVIAVSKGIHAEKEAGNEETESADFTTVFRGFAAAPMNDRETIEKFSGFGTKMITSQENWDAFMAAFCPNAPCEKSVDFTDQNLVVSIMMGARPTYIAADRIVGIDPEYGCPVFDDSGMNRIYALNSENCTHFYVTVVAISEEQAAGSLEVWAS